MEAALHLLSASQYFTHPISPPIFVRLSPLITSIETTGPTVAIDESFWQLTKEMGWLNLRRMEIFIILVLIPK